jgi:uncharacterized surface protein with fasciclin (FAS1) repeats
MVNRRFLLSFVATLVAAFSLPTARAATDPVPDFLEVTRVHGSIVDVAVGNPNFSTLVSALGATNLVSTLQGPGPFTVFAPTNAAFAKIPAPVLNYLLASPAELKKVLLYHVAPGVKDLRFALVPKDFKTVNGQRIYAKATQTTLRINNAQVQGKVIRVNNGVIYVIDSVLLPQYR